MKTVTIKKMDHMILDRWQAKQIHYPTANTIIAQFQ